MVDFMLHDDKNSSTSKYSTFPNKSAVVIDGGYWDQVRKSIGRPEIDIERLCNYLCYPAFRMRTYFFDGKYEDKQFSNRQAYHNYLQRLDRFEVLLGDVVKTEVECPNCKSVYSKYEQKKVDVMLAVKLVHLATTKQTDMIILLAGDRDFLPAITEAKSSGIIVRLAYGQNNYINAARNLIELADEMINLSEEYLRPFCSYKQSNPSVGFLIKILEKLEEQAKEKTFSLPTIGEKLKEKNEDWKLEYRLPLKNSLSFLINRAEKFLVIEKSGKDTKIGLK